MARLFNGIIPALYTVFNDDQSVNYSETARLAQWLAEKGACGFYLCGTTGTGLYLTIDERKKIVETVSDALQDKVPLMVHVGCMTTAESIALAKHAAPLKGVRAMSSLPPQYYPMPFDDEIAHLSEIASATDLPFYPYVLGPMVDTHGEKKLIEAFERIPHMAGLKAFVTNYAVHHTFLKLAPAQWELLHGFDQSLAQALTIPGINAAIGSIYNVVPEVVIAIHKAAQAGDYARAIKLHTKFNGYWINVQGFAFLPFGRYFLTKRGFKMGQPRRPLRPPTAEQIKIVEARMAEVGFNLDTGGM